MDLPEKPTNAMENLPVSGGIENAAPAPSGSENGTPVEIDPGEFPGEDAEDRAMGASEPLLPELPKDLPEPAVDVPLPPADNLPPDATMLALLIKNAALQELWERASKAQVKINQEVNNIPLAKSLLETIRMARNQILAGKGNYEESDRLLSEVEHRLAFYIRMGRSTRKIAPWLLVYELFWLGLLGFFVAVVTVGVFNPKELMAAFPTIDPNQFFNSLVWGGLGGVVGALYALWKHTAEEQDFDPQYSLWYLTNPILGVALGGFVFMIIQAGFFSLTNGSSSGQQIESAAIIYVLAWICGFKQNVVYEIVRRILDVFKVNPEEKPTPEK
ncbi:MAG: hypothetical protein HGA86_02840 [Anaerolineaceae bacterium]|nr:hypothetical protein [Anaerolineaceae bacterium]